MNVEHDHHVPAAAVVHPFEELPEEMFIDGPPAWSQADMDQSSDMLSTYYDDNGTAFLILSDLPTYSSNHLQLPAPEIMHPAMQPALPLQSAQSAPPAPPTPPPPVRSKIRKRWTEEEHELFLDGLERYGRGDWRSISSNCVQSKTPSQIASHAQKYYLRQISEKKRKSIHDKAIEKPHQALLPSHTDHHTHTNHHGGVVMVQESDPPLLPQLTDHQELAWLLRTTGFF